MHRAGVDNPADLPSREPQPQQKDWTGSRLDTEMPQCSTPKVLLPNGQLDPHQYTAEELTAHVAERNPAVAPQPRGKKAATAVTAAVAILPEPNLRPSQLLAEEVHLQPLQQSPTAAGTCTPRKQGARGLSLDRLALANTELA